MIDDDSFMRRNRKRDTNLEAVAVTVLVAGCDYADAATDNAIVMFLQTGYFALDGSACGLRRLASLERHLQWCLHSCLSNASPATSRETMPRRRIVQSGSILARPSNGAPHERLQEVSRTGICAIARFSLVPLPPLCLPPLRRRVAVHAGAEQHHADEFGAEFRLRAHAPAYARRLHCFGLMLFLAGIGCQDVAPIEVTAKVRKIAQL
jgi:hypothetical protein